MWRNTMVSYILNTYPAQGHRGPEPITGTTWYLADAFAFSIMHFSAVHWFLYHASCTGKWEVEPLKENTVTGDMGLVLKSRAKHHAIAALLARPFVFKDKPLVVQSVSHSWFESLCLPYIVHITWSVLLMVRS